MKNVRLVLLVHVLLLVLCAAQAWAQPQAAYDFRSLYMKSEFMIPMRDGTRLYASVYIPKNKPGKHPILLERTPYGAGPNGADTYRGKVLGSRQFIENGYIFAY